MPTMTSRKKKPPKGRWIRPLNNTIVICPEHGVRCWCRTVTESMSFYYCQDAACKYSKKVPRPPAVWVPDR